MGTRLRSVLPGTPKPLATVGDRAFLELLVRQVQSQGFCRLVLCSGYLSVQIEQHFGNGSRWGLSIQHSREDMPLGTGGAVKQAEQYLQGAQEFLVMNGDSFIDIDLNRLVA